MSKLIGFLENYDPVCGDDSNINMNMEIMDIVKNYKNINAKINMPCINISYRSIIVLIISLRFVSLESEPECHPF